MDFTHAVRAFTFVVQEGSFAAAARKMGVTRSAMQKPVTQLEAHLGAQLLTRSTRRVRPTEAGLAFYDRGRELLDGLDQTIAEIRHTRGSISGNLRINSPSSFGILYVAPIAAQFMALHPETNLELVLSDRFVDTIEEGFDVTLRISKPDHATSLVIEEIAATDRVLCASPDYLHKSGTIDSPEALQTRRCLHYGYRQSPITWQLHGPEGRKRVPVNCVMWSNNGDALKSAALHHQGIALLPTFLVGAELRTGQLQRVLPQHHLPGLVIHLLYPRHRHLTRKVQAFAAFLRRSIRNTRI